MWQKNLSLEVLGGTKYVLDNLLESSRLFSGWYHCNICDRVVAGFFRNSPRKSHCFSFRPFCSFCFPGKQNDLENRREHKQTFTSAGLESHLVFAVICFWCPADCTVSHEDATPARLCRKIPSSIQSSISVQPALNRRNNDLQCSRTFAAAVLF